VIAKYQPWSIEVSVDQAHYKNTVGAVGPYNLKSPYHACYYTLIMKLAEWHSKSGQALPVDFIFDDQGSIGLEALLWYEDIRTNHMSPDVQKMLGSTPIFRSDMDILPLQAADMLVWHIRRKSERRYANEKRNTLDVICGSPHIKVEVPNEVIDSWATSMAAMPGIDMLQTKKDWKRIKPDLVHGLSLGLRPSDPGYYLPDSSRKRLSVTARLKRFRGLYKPSRLLKIVRRRFFNRHH
jgi:hypothetical protein